MNYFRVDEQGVDGARRQARRRAAISTPPRSGRPARNSRELAAGHPEPRPSPRRCSPAATRARQDGLQRPRRPVTVVGVIEHMHGSWVELGQGGPRRAGAGDSTTAAAPVYMVRTKPGQRDAVMRTRRSPQQVDNGRVIVPRAPAGVLSRRSYLADDRDMAIYLIVVIALLLGDHRARHFRPRDLQRQHAHQQIGTRRAVGARRATSSATSWSRTGWSRRSACWRAACWRSAVGYWLATKFELPRLSSIIWSSASLGLWVVGPARRLAAGAARGRQCPRPWRRGPCEVPRPR